MFNGIIKNTGKISKIYKKNKNCTLYILSKMKFKKSEIGSSISCSGACLTLEEFNRNLSKFFISKETLSKTIFKYSKKGDVINLEKSSGTGAVKCICSLLTGCIKPNSDACNACLGNDLIEACVVSENAFPDILRFDP